MSQLVVIHQDRKHQSLLKSGASPSLVWADLKTRRDWCYWGTCLRQIAIGLSEQDIPDVTDSEDVFVGLEAYRFLLEIICGLHSPILGETEVFGQFKAFVEELDDQCENAAMFLPTFRQLIKDVKDVRHRFLTHLGSQSYGSLSRREIQDGQSVHILGAGQLAQEILPWVQKKSQHVAFHVRSKSRTDIQNYAVYELSEKNLSLEGVLIVAAPISARELEVWMDRHQCRFVKMIDLRGEGIFDPLNPRVPVVDLAQLMKKLQDRKNEKNEVVELAKEEILRYAQSYASAAKVRPQGWDDLCA